MSADTGHVEGIAGAAEGIEQGVSGADATASGATDGAVVDPNSAAAQAGQEVTATPPEPAMVARGVMDSEIRKVQSAGDSRYSALEKRNSELESRLNAQQAPQTQVQPDVAEQGGTEKYDPAHALKLAETDTEAAFAYQHKHAVADANRNVMAALPDLLKTTLQAHSQESMQQQQGQGAYKEAFDSVVTAHNLSPEELTRAQEAAYNSMQSQNGIPTITPETAAMIGRFGSVEAALAFASAGHAQANQNGALQQGITPAAPAGTPPGLPGQPPTIPGGGNGNVVGQAQPNGGPVHTLRDLRAAL